MLSTVVIQLNFVGVGGEVSWSARVSWKKKLSLCSSTMWQLDTDLYAGHVIKLYCCCQSNITSCSTFIFILVKVISFGSVSYYNRLSLNFYVESTSQLSIFYWPDWSVHLFFAQLVGQFSFIFQGTKVLFFFFLRK